MKRVLFLLALLGLVLCLCSAVEAAAPKKAANATAAAKPDASKIDRLTLRERRAMGLTLDGMMAAARELKASGEPVTAEAIREKLAAKNPKAFAPQAINWDNILAFIEKMLPLILKLIDLFSIDLQPQPYLLAAAIVDDLACFRLQQWFQERRPIRRAIRGVGVVLLA